MLLVCYYFKLISDWNIKNMKTKIEINFKKRLIVKITEFHYSKLKKKQINKDWRFYWNKNLPSDFCWPYKFLLCLWNNYEDFKQLE